MVYRVLADLVMVIHGALLVFFVIGGFLAWRWPRLIWAVLFVAVWNLAIVILDFGCPVTALEKYLRRKGGEQPYARGFIEHYLDGRIWPEGATPTAEKIGFGILVVSYVGFFVIRHRRKSRVTAAP